MASAKDSPFSPIPEVLEDLRRGKMIVLVDDVFTTGATMNECARVLKAHGAREVYSLTVVRASPPGRHNRAATAL